jgi:hypothetical protein
MSLRVEATNSIKNDDDWNNGVTFKTLRRVIVQFERACGATQY